TNRGDSGDKSVERKRIFVHRLWAFAPLQVQVSINGMPDRHAIPICKCVGLSDRQTLLRSCDRSGSQVGFRFGFLESSGCQPMPNLFPVDSRTNKERGYECASLTATALFDG